MHIHQIDARRHAKFLEEQREDPVTGDLIQAGDRVVFCAGCKSAFLADSWEYLGGQHCGGTETLAEFPQTMSLSIRWELERLLYGEDSSKILPKINQSAATFIMVGLMSASGVFFSYASLTAFLAATGFGVIAGLGAAAIAFEGFRRSWMAINDLVQLNIYRNGFELDYFVKQQRFRFSQVERIHFRGKQKWYQINWLEVYFKGEDKPKRIRLPNEFPTLKTLFWSLGSITRYVPVTISVKDKEQQSYLRFLRDKMGFDI
ncbi:MAG: hypothetical protein AAF740_00800 [Bacteroidota bacterium]